MNQLINSKTIISVLCLVFGIASLYTFYPGWMSVDSFSHYQDALNGVYRDWVPVLYSWIWNKFLLVGDGPLPMLLLNISLYWLAFYLLGIAIAKRTPVLGYVIPFLGLWPGLLYELGYLWKDILFAVSMIMCWAILIGSQFAKRKPNNAERLTLLILIIVAFGVKSNGITAIPFIALYWIHIERGASQNKLINYTLIAAIILIPIIAVKLLMSIVQIDHKNKFMIQYTMVYDSLGVSIRTNDLLLPDYIKDRFGKDIENYKKFYYAGGNNHMFFGIGTAGVNAIAENDSQLEQLRENWLSAISSHPGSYLAHRWSNFKSMLRVGSFRPAWVGDAGIVQNEMGLTFISNPFSDALTSIKNSQGWMYLPWVYIILYSLSIFTLIISGSQYTRMWIYLALSIAFFVGPHLFVLPAADYRYLYYAYLGTIVLCVLAVDSAWHRTYRNNTGV